MCFSLQIRIVTYRLRYVIFFFVEEILNIYFSVELRVKRYNLVTF